MTYPNLFSPIKLGTCEVKNRCAMAPMGTGFTSPNESWPKKIIRYYEERAIGGMGLIITQFTRVHGTLASPKNLSIHDDCFIPSHAELVERVHKHGAKIFLQIALAGGKLSGEAPSSIYSPNYAVKPRALTTEEVDGLVEAFIKSFVEGRGCVLNISINDVEQLRAAMKEPEKHRDLKVRVGGYDAYFTDLPANHQELQIKRCEQYA